jgi:hypothetical protein
MSRDLAITNAPWRVRLNGTGSGRWLEVVGEDNYYQGGGAHVLLEAHTVALNNRGTSEAWEPTEDAEEIKANVFLAAAAPEMYKALMVAHDLAYLSFAITVDDHTRITEVCDRYPELHQDMTESQAYAVLRDMELYLRSTALLKARGVGVDIDESPAAP